MCFAPSINFAAQIIAWPWWWTWVAESVETWQRQRMPWGQSLWKDKESWSGYLSICLMPAIDQYGFLRGSTWKVSEKGCCKARVHEKRKRVRAATQGSALCHRSTVAMWVVALCRTPVLVTRYMGHWEGRKLRWPWAMRLTYQHAIAHKRERLIVSHWQGGTCGRCQVEYGRCSPLLWVCTGSLELGIQSKQEPPVCLKGQ